MAKRTTRDRRKQPSDGMAMFPSPGGRAESGANDGSEGDNGSERPVPVIFTQRTFIKIAAWTLGPFLIVISAALYFYHRATVHMDDPNIHLGKLERVKLETKIEAQTERKKIREDIKGHVNIKIREVKVEQKEGFSKIKKELKKQQTRHYYKILREIRKSR